MPTAHLEVGDVVMLKDNREFSGRVTATSGWGTIHLEVSNWAGETGGYRGRDGVLSKTCYPAARLRRLEKVEL